jgi:HEAT repeat protein
MAAVFAVIQASHGLGANAADALFFLRFGVDQLPLMILISGAAVMAFLMLYALGLVLAGTPSWLTTTASACAVWVILEWAAVWLETSAIYPVIWISTQVMIMVTFTVMWNAAESTCDTRQAKRLFPVFASAGVAGGVLGNTVTGPLAGLFGTQHLLIVQAALLATGGLLLFRMRSMFRRDTEEEPSSLRTEMVGAVRTVRSSRLLVLASAAVFLVSVLFFLVVFPFSQAVTASFSSEAEVAGFLGLFASIATAITFAVALVLTNRILARWGIVFALLLVPLTYAAGFGLWLVAFSLGTAAIVRGVQWVTVNAIWGTGFPALFNVLTGRRRGQIMAFMVAIPAQLGTMAAGVILIMGTQLSPRVRFTIGLGLALVASTVVYAMRPAYVEGIVSAVRKGLVGVFTVPTRGVLLTLDGDARRILTEHLADPRPGARAMAAAALAAADDRSATNDVEALFTDESPEVRSAAFGSMCIIDPHRIDAHVRTALADPEASVRIEALRFLSGSDLAVSSALAAESVADPDPGVRAVAIVAVGHDAGAELARGVLERAQGSEIRPLLEEMARASETFGMDLSSFLADDDPAVRAAAATLGRHAIPSKTLAISLDDASLRVRKAAAESLAGSSSGKALLLQALQTGSVAATDAALAALTELGEQIPEFAHWAVREAGRAANLQAAARALERLGASPQNDSSSARSYLVSVLNQRAARLLDWALEAMTTFETSAVMETVERGVRSGDSETRAQSIEALETVGSRSVLKALLPVLEPPVESAFPSVDDALRSLSIDFDPWLRSLAIRSMEELGYESVAVPPAEVNDVGKIGMPSLEDMSIDSVDTLSRMDRMLALQRVPMFSALDPEDLDLIAGVVNEVHYGPGERIYSDGETGDAMLVIVEGSTVVSKKRGGKREIVASYGPGNYVGELALVSGDERVADVDAGNDGVLGVVVTKTDLRSILEERPGVALGMLATLARRLASQT